MGDPTKKVHVLTLDGEEYIYWVALFEDPEEAKAAAKTASEALAEGSSYGFRVDEYKFYEKGSPGPTLEQIKSDVNDHVSLWDEDSIWKQTAEERVEDLDYLGFAERVEELSSELGLNLFLPSDVALAALPRDRQVAIVEWVYESDHTTKPPMELDGSVSPGQQELPS